MIAGRGSGDFTWQRAASAVVNELGWCLFSAPIVDQLPPATSMAWPCPEDRGGRELLAMLDEDPRPLENHLANRSDHRLGARFEAMWTFYLDAHPRYDLLASNWPVQGGGRTLGALDLLFRDRELDAVIHGEIAVKFYLYHPETRGDVEQRWIGPYPDDTLHLKLTHLADHQLPLSTREETRQQLREAGLPLPDQRVATVKGYLFQPWAQSALVSDRINPEHLGGFWLYRHQLSSMLARSNHRQWAILDRQFWLRPRPGQFHGALSERIDERLAARPFPVMACAKPPNGDTMPIRYFVVPDEWPDALRSGPGPK